MTKYNIWVEKNNPYKCVFGARVDVDSEEDLKELQEFIRAGVNAYEDWRAERDA